MIVPYINSLPAARPNPVGQALSRRAWPLDCRTPEPLLKVLEELNRR